MGPGATRTTKNGYFVRPIQQGRKGIDLIIRRAHGGLWRGKMKPRYLLNSLSHCYIARNSNYSDAAPRNCVLDRDFEHAWHLLRLGNQFAIVTALREEMLRISLLKISAADLVTRDLSRNGKDRNPAPM